MINLSDIQLELESQIPTNNLVVAYSGGLDSHVLLHLLTQIPSLDKNIRAIHIDHGLQHGSNRWAQHCLETCDSLGINLDVVTLNLTVSKGQSLEEVARQGRYKALHQSLDVNESLLTAHHQSDQAETFLLQLFRGAGVEGLSSMPASRFFGEKGSEHQLLRPLLSYSRDALENYAEKQGLIYIEDPSNKDEVFDRNFLRQSIIPELRKRWVGIEKSISRAASIQSEAREILNEVAEGELQHILNFKNNSLSILKLNLLTKSKQKLVVRYWIAESGFSYPSEKKLQHIFSDVIEAKEDTQPLLEWEGVQLRRFQGSLYVSEPLLEHDSSQVINWDGASEVTIKSLGLIIQPKDLPSESANVTIRFRQGGEKIRIAKRGNLSLKNIFQEEGIPSWMRDRLPLVYVDDELRKIIGLDLDN